MKYLFPLAVVLLFGCNVKAQTNFTISMMQPSERIEITSDSNLTIIDSNDNEVAYKLKDEALVVNDSASTIKVLLDILQFQTKEFSRIDSLYDDRQIESFLANQVIKCFDRNGKLKKGKRRGFILLYQSYHDFINRHYKRN